MKNNAIDFTPMRNVNNSYEYYSNRFDCQRACCEDTERCYQCTTGATGSTRATGSSSFDLATIGTVSSIISS